MELPPLPSIWTLYLDEAIPILEANKKDYISRLQTILVFVGFCLAAFFPASQMWIQHQEADTADLVDLTYHMSFQIFNSSTPPANDPNENHPIPNTVYPIVVLSINFVTLSMIAVLTYLVVRELVVHRTQLEPDYKHNLRDHTLAISRKRPLVLPRIICWLCRCQFILMLYLAFDGIYGWVGALMSIGALLILGFGIFIVKRARGYRPTQVADRFSETLLGHGEQQEQELPAIRIICTKSTQNDSLLGYTLAMRRFNEWRIPIHHRIDGMTLGWSLNRLLRCHSLPREYPRKYSSQEVQLLPLLAECAADQYIDGLEYIKFEDEACSHTEVGEGGISALFGDLSNLKHPSQLELDIIVQLALWRNRPLEDSFRSLWIRLQSGRCNITGRPYPKRLLAYACQRLRSFAITSRESDVSEFMMWVTTELPVFSDLIGIDDPSQKDHERLRSCTLMCRSPWFQAYISQGERCERIIEVLENEQLVAAERAFTSPHLKLQNLIDCIPYEENDEVIRARLETVRCFAVSRANAPHVSQLHNPASH